MTSATYARTTDRKSTRLNSSHRCISYAVFCLKKTHIGDPHASGRALQAAHPGQGGARRFQRGPLLRSDQTLLRQRQVFFLKNAAPPQTSTLPLQGPLRI